MTEENETEMEGFKKLCRQHAEVAAVELNQGPKALAMDRQINIIQKELETAVQKLFGFDSLHEQITDLQSGLAQILESKGKTAEHLAAVLGDKDWMEEDECRTCGVVLHHSQPFCSQPDCPAHLARLHLWELFKAERNAKPKSDKECGNCNIVLTVEEVERVGSSATDDDMTCEMCDLQMYGDD